MNELHKELLSLGIKVKKVLDDNNITYGAIGGTAIGAIREKGFIPGDDDIDIMVLEEQMQLFIKKIEESGLTNVSPYLKFNPYPFEKIYGETEISNFGERDKLFIDVFPAQVKRKGTKLGGKLFRFRDDLLYVKSKRGKNGIKGSEGFGVYFGLMFTKHLISWVPTRLLLGLQRRSISIKRVEKDASTDIRYTYFKENGLPLKATNFKDVRFESDKIRINTDYQKDMFSVFGDFTKKPKVKSQINHNIKIRRKNDE